MANFNKDYNIDTDYTSNILFRADSSSKIGLGHIMRDLVLAAQYPNANITFATLDLEGNINHKILEAGYKVHILESSEKKELKNLIQSLQIDLLVIDHYGIDFKIEKYIKEKTGVKILSLDDTYEKHHCDILLNHNISAKKKKHKHLVPKNCELRCGSAFTLLREEFYEQKKKEYKKYTYITTIFLAMGGSDSSNVNLKILKVLSEFKNIQVHLITTSSNSNLSILQEYVQDKEWVKLHINSTNIAKLMRKSDFGIITPSVTANEAYFMELHFIAIQTAQNQDDIYKYLKMKGYFVLDVFNAAKLKKLIKMELDKTERVTLIDFVDLSLEEKKMVLEWRNHQEIKKWMHTKDDIKLESHLDFIDSLQNKKDKQYMVVKKDGNYIGVVDFYDIDREKKECEFGLYVNPFKKQAGTGKVLQGICIEYAFEFLNLTRLKLEVFEENEKARGLYRKYKFQEIAEIIINDKKVICMILNKN